MARIGASLLESQGDDLATVVRFAELLDQGWKLKRQLGSPVSNSARHRRALPPWKGVGIWGGKLLGAGGGGFVLFLADPKLHPIFSDRFGSGNVLSVSLTNGGGTTLKPVGNV